MYIFMCILSTYIGMLGTYYLYYVCVTYDCPFPMCKLWRTLQGSQMGLWPLRGKLMTFYHFYIPYHYNIWCILFARKKALEFWRKICNAYRDLWLEISNGLLDCHHSWWSHDYHLLSSEPGGGGGTLKKFASFFAAKWQAICWLYSESFSTHIASHKKHSFSLFGFELDWIFLALTL